MSIDSTRTLLFGMFVLAGRKLTATEVVELAKPLSLSATNVKSHLTRMVEDGALRRSGPARQAQYWPSGSQTRVVDAIVERLQGNHLEPWDGRWIMLTLKMPATRASRERLKAELWFDGFRPYGPCVFVRPAWPKDWALSRARLHFAEAPGLCICGPPIPPIEIDDVNAMYGLELLDREARRLGRRIAMAKVSMLPAARAFATRIKMSGLVARLVGHDPRLPLTLWGGRTGMRDLIRAFRRFEARTAPISQRFLDSVFR
jgi:DNA-binding transcriptional regulator PaaX